MLKHIFSTQGKLPLLLLLYISFLFASPALADPGRPTFGRRSVNGPGEAPAPSSYTLNSTLDEIMDGSKSYDAHTIWVMQGLKDITQPFWDPYDVDYERNDRAVTKAATIQGGRHLSSLIKGSELKSTFDYLKRSLQEVKSYFNYSIQSDGEDTFLSKGKKGKKILELSMEFNLAQGLDPNLKLGEHLSFRYDYVNRRPLMEIGFNF